MLSDGNLELIRLKTQCEIQEISQTTDSSLEVESRNLRERAGCSSAECADAPSESDDWTRAANRSLFVTRWGDDEVFVDFFG